MGSGLIHSLMGGDHIRSMVVGEMTKIQEQDLFDPIKKWLEEKGYEVYAEVELPSGRADIVAVHGPAKCIVEMKTSLTMELIEQAMRWLDFAHYVYIAIPQRKKYIPVFVQNLLREKRIGILTVDFHYNYVRHYMPARFNRPAKKLKWFKWEDYLYEEQKTWVKGGVNNGGHVTPYKLTIKKVQEYLYWQRDWKSIREILEHCETHYAHPKPSLTKALLDFENDWCEAKKENGVWFFRHK
ncbi:hypothetical protein C1N76_10900 [Geobacillus thermoleovorans]|uniref:Sce7726 family protein n=2 Tax=Geobacillus thermoleovorans TaxID=33941 RepID=A0A2Z3NB68_GEOTH|nr:hypothetical protein C1N76_10900 [Geobacillus thermoleovorans]MBW7642578.1 hypothetical protein [Geobacillus thermoleovorans]